MTVEEYKEKVAKIDDAMLKGMMSAKQGASEKRKLSTYNSDIVKKIKEAEQK